MITFDDKFHRALSSTLPEWDSLADNEAYNSLSDLKPPQKPITIISNHLWHIFTDQGEFAVKQLLVSEEKKWQNFKQGQEIAAALQKKNIPAVTALHYQNNWAIFPWVAGTALSPDAATIEQAKTIGGLLADIHNADLQLENIAPAVWHNSTVIDENLLKNNFPELKVYYKNYCNAYNKLKNTKQIISHGDLTQANIIWDKKNSPHIIDWDAAGTLHPQIELFGVALNWSGINTGEINQKIFDSVLTGYKNNNGVVAITEEIKWASLGSWFNWLLFNIEQELTGEKTAAQEIINTLTILQRIALLKNNQA